MTAWAVLVGNSTLPDNGINTSWDHLNNQQGGGGGAPYPVYITQANDGEINTSTDADIVDRVSAEIVDVTVAEAPI